MTSKRLFLSAGLFLVIFPNLSYSHMKNVTYDVFGSKLDRLPVAFGDFNGDRITDLFTIDPEKSKVSVLLGTEDTITIMGQKQYFSSNIKEVVYY